MPYTSQELPFSTCETHTDDGIVTFGGGKSIGKYQSRAGTNRNSVSDRNNAPRSPGRAGHYILVPHVVYNGPRLPYKQWVPRIGKFVWARAPITVYRKKWVPAPKAKKGQKELQPNDLTFLRCFRSDPGQHQIVYTDRTSGPERTRSITGDLVIGAWRNDYVSLKTVNPVDYNFFSVNPLGLPGVQALVDDLTSQSISRLYAKAKNQKVNLAQAYAERAQTAATIADCAVRIAKTLRDIRRGNLVQAAKTLLPGDSKQLANDILLIQYGIRPLASDIMGLIDHVTRPDPEISYDIGSTAKDSIDQYVLFDQSSDLGYCTVRDLMTMDVKVTVKHKTRVKVKSSALMQFNSLGLTNLAAVTWELVPYSFIADWLLPIGDYLNNMDAFQGLEAQWSTRTVFIECTQKWTREITGGSHPDYTLVQGLSGGGMIQDSTFCSREKLLGNPELGFPSPKNPFSGGHVLNAAALIRQLFK